MESKDDWYVEMPVSVKKAFDSRDALGLYRACERTNYFIDGELFGELYEQGKFEAEQDENLILRGLEGNVKRNFKSFEKKNPVVVRNAFSYLSFLEGIERLGINVENLGADRSYKEGLLRQCFAKFANGKQDLRGYSDAKLGKVFYRVRDQARKVAYSLAG